jgi:glyoxylase-like metal-dependent hydrolase (beta-lactamase superfamily II)
MTSSTGGAFTQLGPSLYRVGTGLVNSYLVEEAGEVTIVDAGVAGQWRGLVTGLEAMGRMLDDVRAIVLTHGHSDHIGFAERARRERGWPVSVHEADAALARGEVPNPAKNGPVKVRPLASFIWWTLRYGGLRTTHLGEVSTFGDGATLDAPGTPRVILVPGHTPGSAALHFARHDALLAGDSLCTLAVTTGHRGPRIAPFAADAEQARDSLSRLSGVSARLVLPGHGEPFDRGVDEAIRLAREAPLPI